MLWISLCVVALEVLDAFHISHLVNLQIPDWALLDNALSPEVFFIKHFISIQHSDNVLVYANL